MKTAINKTSNWGGFLERPEHIYPVYETDLTVPTGIEELRSLPAFPSVVRISELVLPFEELMGPMNPTSYRPTEHQLWSVQRIPPKTWKNCRETSETKARTHTTMI